MNIFLIEGISFKVRVPPNTTANDRKEKARKHQG
jgi:hypothetical protein